MLNYLFCVLVVIILFLAINILIKKMNNSKKDFKVSTLMLK